MRSRSFYDEPRPIATIASCRGLRPGLRPGPRPGHGPGARIPDEMLNPLRRGALIVALGLLLRPDAALAQAQPAAAAPVSRTRAHVDTLASPKLEGRLTGSPGADAAAAYIEAELKRIGARPLPGGFGFRVPFTFTAGVKDEGTSVSLMPVDAADKHESWSDRSAVAALSFSESGDGDGARRLRRLRPARPRRERRRLRLRQLRRPRREGQDRARPALRAGEGRARAARADGPVFGAPLQGAGGPPGRRQGHADRVGAELSRPRPGDPADVRHGRVRLGHRRGQRERARRQRACSHWPARTLREAQDALDTGNPHVAGFRAGHAQCDRQREADVARPRRPTTSPDTSRPRATSPASPSRG